MPPSHQSSSVSAQGPEDPLFGLPHREVSDGGSEVVFELSAEDGAVDLDSQSDELASTQTSASLRRVQRSTSQSRVLGISRSIAESVGITKMRSGELFSGGAPLELYWEIYQAVFNHLALLAVRDAFGRPAEEGDSRGLSRQKSESQTFFHGVLRVLRPSSSEALIPKATERPTPSSAVLPVEAVSQPDLEVSTGSFVRVWGGKRGRRQGGARNKGSSDPKQVPQASQESQTNSAGETAGGLGVASLSIASSALVPAGGAEGVPSANECGRYLSCLKTYADVSFFLSRAQTFGVARGPQDLLSASLARTFAFHGIGLEHALSYAELERLCFSSVWRRHWLPWPIDNAANDEKRHNTAPFPSQTALLLRRLHSLPTQKATELCLKHAGEHSEVLRGSISPILELYFGPELEQERAASVASQKGLRQGPLVQCVRSAMKSLDLVPLVVGASLLACAVAGLFGKTHVILRLLERSFAMPLQLRYGF